MPPAIGAAIITAASAAVSALAASGVISALAATLITIGLTIAGALMTLLLRPKVKGQGQEVRLKLDANMPRQVAVGLTATGGSSVFAFTYTNDSDKPNRYMYRIISLSDFPVHSCVRVMEGKDVLTFETDIHTSFAQCNQHKSKKGKNRMWLQIYKGSFSPTVHPGITEDSGGLWTANHKGVGQCYAVVRYDYDADAFPNGEPQLTFVLQGAHIYDDRKDGSKPGRTGTHRLDTYSTWEYSENIANITAQYLRGFYVNGQLIVGVQAEERDLPDAMLTSAYNICDEVVDSLGGDVARYRGGRMLTASEEAADVLSDLQAAMDGRIHDRGGKITLLPGAIRTPVMNLTDDDIVWTEEKSWQPISNQSELFNYMSGTYIDGDVGFESTPYPPMTNTDWEEDDGGERFAKTFDLNAVPYRTQAQRIIKRKFEASRFQTVVGFVGPLWLLELEQGDWFTLTSDRWDMEEKTFQAEFVHIMLESMQVAVIARETSSDIDSWDPVENESPPTDDTYNPPAPELPVPVFTVDPYLDTAASGAISSLLVDITTDVDETSIQGFQMQIAYASDLLTFWSGPNISSESPSIVVPGLTPETEYGIRLRSYDGVDYSDWSAWVTETTPALPNSLPSSSTDNAIARFDGVDGKIQNSNVILDDSGNIATPGYITVAAEVYGAPWNGSNQVPTKNDTYDAIESVSADLDAAVADLDTEKTDRVTTTTDNAIVRFDGVAGDQQNSAVTIDDTGRILVPTGALIYTYNTSDQVTNYERMEIGPVSNVWTIAGKVGGTGTARALSIQAGSTNNLTINTGTAPSFDFTRTTGNPATLVRLLPTWTQSGGDNVGLSIAPAITQTSTAGYTVYDCNVTETSLGTGVHYLARLRVGGTIKFSVNNEGTVTSAGGRIHALRVVTAAGAVTVATTDYIIVVNKTTGAATAVNLPATPTTGRVYIIKDGKGDAATNNLTITPAAGNIDGAGTYVMNVNYQVTSIVYNGSEWSII